MKILLLASILTGLASANPTLAPSTPNFLPTPSPSYPGVPGTLPPTPNPVPTLPPILTFTPCGSGLQMSQPTQTSTDLGNGVREDVVDSIHLEGGRYVHRVITTRTETQPAEWPAHISSYDCSTFNRVTITQKESYMPLINHCTWGPWRHSRISDRRSYHYVKYPDTFEGPIENVRPIASSTNYYDNVSISTLFYFKNYKTVEHDPKTGKYSGFVERQNPRSGLYEKIVSNSDGTECTWDKQSTPNSGGYPAPLRYVTNCGFQNNYTMGNLISTMSGYSMTRGAIGDVEDNTACRLLFILNSTSLTFP